MDEDYAVAFNLIAQAGDARSSAMLALHAAREGDFDAATAHLASADEALSGAHQSQTGLVQSEARGDKVPVNIILVHAQDHLMSAMVVRDLADEMVHLYRRTAALPTASPGE